MSFEVAFNRVTQSVEYLSLETAMSTRSRLTACASLACLVLVPSLVRAQASRTLSVAYDNARLSEIAASFATFSGRAIAVDSAADDPFVTASVQDVDWEVGLDRILAQNALIARPIVGGGLRIERERRISVAYQGARLDQVAAEFAAFANRRIELPRNATDLQVTTTIENTDWQRALDQILQQSGLIARWDVDGVMRIVSRSAR